MYNRKVDYLYKKKTIVTKIFLYGEMLHLSKFGTQSSLMLGCIENSRRGKAKMHLVDGKWYND